MCDQIGILHRGKLLDSGSVDGVFHRMTGLLPEIRVRLSEAADRHLHLWLNNQKFVSSPTASDPLHLHFHFDGSDADLSSLISKMIAKGYLVCRVEEQQRSLEDILLDLEYDGH